MTFFQPLPLSRITRAALMGCAGVVTSLVLMSLSSIADDQVASVQTAPIATAPAVPVQVVCIVGKRLHKA
jgi:hypothetical protein